MYLSESTYLEPATSYPFDDDSESTQVVPVENLDSDPDSISDYRRILILLKAEEFDSEMVFTHTTTEEGTHIDITENSVSDIIIPVELASSYSGSATAQIYDLNGKLHSTQRLLVESGANQVILDAGKIPMKEFLVRIVGGADVLSARVVAGRR